MENNSTVIPVVAAALIAEDGRVLLQQRRIGSAHGGLWEFPGGKVEAGESLSDALIREIDEELAVILAKQGLRPLCFAASDDNPHVVMLYTATQWSGAPQCLQGERIGWFALNELPGLPLAPLDVPLAQALRERQKG